MGRWVGGVGEDLGHLFSATTRPGSFASRARSDVRQHLDPAAGLALELVCHAGTPAGQGDPHPPGRLLIQFRSPQIKALDEACGTVTSTTTARHSRCSMSCLAPTCGGGDGAPVSHRSPRAIASLDRVADVNQCP